MRRVKITIMLLVISLWKVLKSPMACLSVNDNTTDSDEVFFNTKVHKYIFTTSRDKLDHLLN